VQLITSNDSINHNKGRKNFLFFFHYSKQNIVFIEEINVQEMDMNVSRLA